MLYSYKHGNTVNFQWRQHKEISCQSRGVQQGLTSTGSRPTVASVSLIQYLDPRLIGLWCSYAGAFSMLHH